MFYPYVSAFAGIDPIKFYSPLKSYAIRGLSYYYPLIFTGLLYNLNDFILPFIKFGRIFFIHLIMFSDHVLSI